MEGINPKDAVGSAKPPHSTVPLAVLAEVGIAMLEGSLKYGRHNYRASKIRASVYYDAARRHIDSWFEGEDIDPDSGLSHVTKAITSLVVLRDSMINDLLADDRPPKILPWHKEYLQRMTNQIMAKYPEPKAPYTEESHPAWERNMTNALGPEPIFGRLTPPEFNGINFGCPEFEITGAVPSVKVTVRGVQECGFNHHNEYEVAPQHSLDHPLVGDDDGGGHE